MHSPEMPEAWVDQDPPTSKRRIAALEQRRAAHRGKRGPNGRRLCMWCGQEVPKRRRTFCSPECVHEWRLRSDPSYLRFKVWERDRGVCARCGLDTEALERELSDLLSSCWKARTEEEWEAARERFWRRVEELGVVTSALRVPHLWEVDHIVPVAEGGDSNLENVRTLCWRCHREVTAQYARHRALRRIGQAVLFGATQEGEA